MFYYHPSPINIAKNSFHIYIPVDLPNVVMDTSIHLVSMTTVKPEPGKRKWKVIQSPTFNHLDHQFNHLDVQSPINFLSVNVCVMKSSAEPFLDEK